MLTRALHLARAQYPFLEGVRAGKAPDAYLQGLEESSRGVDAETANQGLLAVLGTLLDLLIRFIGEELTFRLLAEVWTDVPQRQPLLPRQLDGQEAAS
jgi:hypothetical protein